MVEMLARGETSARKRRVTVPDGADPDARREADPRRCGFEGLGVCADRSGHEPELGELGSANPGRLPAVMVYQSAVRDGDCEFTFGQPDSRPLYETFSRRLSPDGWEVGAQPILRSSPPSCSGVEGAVGEPWRSRAVCAVCRLRRRFPLPLVGFMRLGSSAPRPPRRLHTVAVLVPTKEAPSTTTPV